MMLYQTLICLVSLTVHGKKIIKKMKVIKKKISNDAEMESYGTRDDLKI
jgi:hypothetical protein